jgi:Protein of unknown function (DUF2924)
MIAARVQEEAFGTLDRATLKLLDGLARRDGSRTAERKIGTVLVRDYQGRRHTVTVEPEGYVWEGQPYSSLSAIARAITGTARLTCLVCHYRAIMSAELWGYKRGKTNERRYIMAGYASPARRDGAEGRRD